MKTILITGGAGFIGSHVVRLFVNKYPNYNIINLDKLTYAGNLENIVDIQDQSNYKFVKGDINDITFLQTLFTEHKITDVIHLAAESHVDRSISGPMEFINTNIIGTANLLEVARTNWQSDDHIFYHISTDEVYGSLGKEGFFTEETAYDPRSPYSASKASSDHIARAYAHTYGMNLKISNCSNNYGSHQFPEKLIPLMINNIVHNKPLPIYGTGENVRDWLWVEDHAKAIDTVFHTGKTGETYNIGGWNEWTNIDLVQLLCSILDKKLDRAAGSSARLITYVKDRAGHDARYAIDANKIKNELNWEPSIQFEEGLEKTVDWYLNNEDWVNDITSGAYQDYYKEHYK
ncbi:dTDP-glucose 4,6-dehydratase [Crocinitomix catalasitica]|uniref:dTDP-glucose 4,6-dehydratase n=1 Tax=Crocinitomix catalasitica TaxID=184607 RepID=UPI000481F9D3|nr:dTDP-glucose 4,6-dehydratase [Crocinitomix catalasitica]